jgi:tRNA threonylcarbamoyl adenosine modification protein YeaZ
MNNLKDSITINKTIFLCIDTSSHDCQAGIVESVARSVRLLAKTLVRNRRAHSEKIIALIDHVIKQSDISKKDLAAVAVSIGPGSFTGLRIGLSVAKGLALAMNIPVIPISTHDAIARPYRSNRNPALVMTIAKKNEWFVTKYFEQDRSQTAVMNVEQWSSLLEPSMTILCDDAVSVRRLISTDLISSCLIPEGSFGCPDMESLGKIAVKKYFNQDLNNDLNIQDDLTPDYVQSFLGKM